MMHTIIRMGNGASKTELLDYFAYDIDTATISAFTFIQ